MSEMLSKKILLLFCSLALIPAMLFAEGDLHNSHIGLTRPGIGLQNLPGTSQGLSLLDPGRLQMSQSYGLAYSYYSGQRGGDLVGLYQNVLSYQLSQRLDVKVGLGYLHRPVEILTQNDAIRTQALMTAFQVDFRPFDNVFIQFNYQSLPAIGYRDPLGRYRSGWSAPGH
jgi:hypothetical protein